MSRRAKEQKLTPQEKRAAQLHINALKAVSTLSTHFENRKDSRMFLANKAWWKLWDIEVPIQHPEDHQTIMKTDKETKHTPGPWKVAGLGINGRSIWQTASNEANRGWGRICNNVSSAEDAQLIAAAPELLNACQFALQYTRFLPAPLAVELRNAIKKATL